jgi:hypothetical protein
MYKPAGTFKPLPKRPELKFRGFERISSTKFYAEIMFHIL